MTFCAILVELRRRARAICPGVPPTTRLEQAASDALAAIPSGPRRKSAMRLFEALVDPEKESSVDQGVLADLTPDAIVRIDFILEAVIDIPDPQEAKCAILVALAAHA